MRVLIVDDSVVFRSQIKAALDGTQDIVVVASAANGKIGLERLEQEKIDVVILDLEMPEMDGLAMLNAMRKKGLKQKVIVFSAANSKDIDHTLEALRAGASDFIIKPISNGSFEQTLEGVKRQLVPKILQFKAQNILITNETQLKNSEVDKILPELVNANPKNTPLFKNPPLRIYDGFKPKVIAIGASTGGPPAIEKIFFQLKEVTLRIPIFLVQHLPSKFTEAFAKRLQDIALLPVHEAIHDEIVQPGHVYVAPGDYHMTLEESFDKQHVKIKLDQGPKRNSVRPAVDPLFESIANIYANKCAAFVLTGMGEDGKEGAQVIKSVHGHVIIQDETSSTVWGMPGAIYSVGAYDMMKNLDECAKYLVQLIQ
jgi:two-component system chemotaxis response regulator CheB